MCLYLPTAVVKRRSSAGVGPGDDHSADRDASMFVLYDTGLMAGHPCWWVAGAGSGRDVWRMHAQQNLKLPAHLIASIQIQVAL